MSTTIRWTVEGERKEAFIGDIRKKVERLEHSSNSMSKIVERFTTRPRSIFFLLYFFLLFSWTIVHSCDHDSAAQTGVTRQCLAKHVINPTSCCTSALEIPCVPVYRFPCPKISKKICKKYKSKVSVKKSRRRANAIDRYKIIDRATSSYRRIKVSNDKLEHRTRRNKTKRG